MQYKFIDRSIIHRVVIAVGAMICASCSNAAIIDADSYRSWLNGDQVVSKGEGVAVFSVEPVIEVGLIVERIEIAQIKDKKLSVGGPRFAGTLATGHWRIVEVVVADNISGNRATIMLPDQLPDLLVAERSCAAYGLIRFAVGEKMVLELTRQSKQLVADGIENQLIQMVDDQLGALAFLYLPKGNPVENNGLRIKAHWGEKISR